MKKLFKAAASLAIGCAMLQASAFAALTGTVTGDNGTYDVNVAGLGEGESTILVYKTTETGLEALPANISESNIAYINQQTAEDGEANYTVAVELASGEILYFFVGGSHENSATLIGTKTYTSSGEEYTLGDVNNDGDIDISDAIQIINYISWLPSSLDELTEEAALAVADVNSDGDIDISDAIQIINYISWLPSSLDEE